MGRELIDAFDRVDNDNDVRAIIVTGEGLAFCAGADLSSGADIFDRDAQRGHVKRLPDGTADYGDPKVRDSGGQLTVRIFKTSQTYYSCGERAGRWHGRDHVACDEHPHRV